MSARFATFPIPSTVQLLARDLERTGAPTRRRTIAPLHGQAAAPLLIAVSMLLALALVLGFCQAFTAPRAFADEGSGQVLTLSPQSTIIDSISMTLTPPEAGARSTNATSSVSVTTEGIASYSASWQDHTGVSTQEPETLDFVAGNTYYAMIFLYPAEGYAFKTNGTHSYDAYTNDTYYGGGLPASLDIESAGIQASTGRMCMLVRVTATEVQPRYLGLGVSEGGTYGVTSADSLPDEGMDSYMNLAMYAGDSVTLSATPATGYVFKGFYTGIRQMDSTQEGYGFVTDYDPNSLVSAENPYTFTMSENVNIYALFGKPTITLHWSSVEQADLKEPVVIEKSGDDVYDTIKAGLHMSQGPNWEATTQIAGYIESGYFTPEPMSSYSSRAELDDADVLWDEVTEDMDVYVCMNKVIDDAKIAIEAPVAGDETTTPGDAYSSHTNWHWGEQTNKPLFSVSGDEPYEIGFDTVDPPYEARAFWTEAVDKRYDFGEPFIGTFAAGETYYAQVVVLADFGYGFASDNPYARDPKYSGTATVDGGAFENAFLDGILYTDYLHLAVSVTAVPSHELSFAFTNLYPGVQPQTLVESLTVNGEDWTPTSGNIAAKDIPAGSSVTATVKVTDNASLATYNNPGNTIADLGPTYSDDNSEVTFAFTMPETDARIVVYLFEAVTITYDANGGAKQPAWTDSVKQMKYTAGTPATINVSQELYDMKSGEPRVLPPAGSTFAGIEVTQNKTGAKVTGKPGETITVDFSEGGTIKYLWADDPDTTAVRFEAGEGSGTMAPVVIDPSEDYTLPECTFTQPSSNHVLVGWKLVIDGTEGEQYFLQPGNVISSDRITGDITLTALWAKQTAYLYYSSGEGEGGTVFTGSSLAGNSYEARKFESFSSFKTPAGKHFDGWIVTNTGGCGRFPGLPRRLGPGSFCTASGSSSRATA